MPTIKIPDSIWKVAMDGAVDATLIRREPVKTTDIIKFALEEYLEEAVQNFLKIEKEKKK